MILKRALAFSIDYFIIIIYAVILFGITLYLESIELISLENIGPVEGQLIGLFTLTIPVFCYFFLSESSKKSATVGKRMMSIKIDTKELKNSERIALFKRNLFKFIPWEIAHTGVHWLLYYDKQSLEPGILVWSLLILPQLIVMSYILSIFLSAGSESLYDKLSEVRVKAVI